MAPRETVEEPVSRQVSLLLFGFFFSGPDVTCRERERGGEGRRGGGLFSFQCTPSGPADNVSFLTFELEEEVRGVVIAIGGFSRNPHTSISVYYFYLLFFFFTPILQPPPSFQTTSALPLVFSP